MRIADFAYFTLALLAAVQSYRWGALLATWIHRILDRRRIPLPTIYPATIYITQNRASGRWELRDQGRFLIHVDENLAHAYAAQHRASKIASPPGRWLRRIAEFGCSPKTYRTVFDPMLADFEYEYFEALKGGRTRKAAWIRVRYSVAFFHAAWLHTLLKAVGDAWKTLRGVTTD